jgi:thermitase
VSKKIQFIYLVMFLVCAFLPMTPIMNLAVNTLTPGYISELEADNTPVRPSVISVIQAEASRWDLLKIQAPEAWQFVSGGRNIVVAVLDTGIDAENKNLRGKIIGRTNFTSSSGIDVDRGHGTHIAGLIAAAPDKTGVAGLAYNCSLLDVQVAENNGTSDAQKLAKGIIWAVDQGAQVINISVVINKPYPLLEYAVNYAWEKGSLIIAAAGNGCSSDPVYPAAYPHVIAVAATDKTDGLVKWSNHGEWVDTAAPGVDIYSTLPGNKTGYKSGSSFSTGLVSGEAALLYAWAADTNHDSRVNDDVSNLIINNCDLLESPDYRLGRINVCEAARSATAVNETLK